MVRLQRLASFLEAHFGNTELVIPDHSKPENAAEVPRIVVRLDDTEAEIDLVDLVRSGQVSPIDTFD